MEKTVMEDIARIRTASGLRFSPDGKKAVYTVTVPDREKNDYRSDLWVLDRESGTSSQMTYTGKNSGAIWDDNSTLLFSTARKDEDKPDDIEEKTVFYRLPVCGGEAREAFSLKANVQDLKKISDNLYAMRILTDRNRPDPETTDKELCREELDYHIFEEVPFWGNGRGFVSGKRSVLCIYHADTGEVKRLSGEYTSVGAYEISGNLIAYVHRTWQDVITVKAGLSIYNLETGETETVVPEEKMKIESIAFNDLGLIYTACDMEKWGNGQLTDFYVYDLKEKKSALLHKNTEELAFGDTPMTDTMRPGGISFKGWNDQLYFTAMQHFHTDLYVLEADGTMWKAADFAGGAIVCFDADENGIAMIGSEPDSLNALYILKDGNPVRVHDVNEGILDGRYIAKAEYIPFTDSDGYQVDGWVLKPKDFDPEKKYPGILEIHGGPRGAYGTILYHEMQIWASMGYFVFFCNPRGSEGYGEAFADLRGKYGTIDFTDLMEFTDHVLETFPQIDSARLGASGGSYGGFMCNWIEGNTDRFAAIASQRSVSNWVADFGASEIGVTFDSNEMAATPWTDMQKMWDQSPLKYACNAKTPILFIHSLCDYNCPIDQGVEMFTAMKYFHVPSRMVVFEGENHGLSRNGKPKHRIRRLKEITGWFETYLKK